MHISDIENMRHKDLKANKAELIEAAEQFDSKEVARRYVQARTDAMFRDEKMGEQGKQISELEALLKSHLTVEVSKDRPYDPFDDLNAESSVTVKIMFDGRVIAEDTA